MDAIRAALLIDGDNLGAQHHAAFKQETEKLGRLDVARVYGGHCVSEKWLTSPGLRFMQAGEGKNAADLLLSIDAMELAFSGGIDAFAIASSDGDFTHLAQRLREKGFFVLGLGDDRAPERFRQSCHAFHLLPEKKPSATPTRAVTKDQTKAAPSAFDEKIRQVIKQNCQNASGIEIRELSHQMRRAHDTKIGTHPERSWRKYLVARPTLYDLDPPSAEAKVRFLPAGFAAN